MNKLIDWVMSLPKWGQIALSVVLVSVAIGGAAFYLYKDNKPAAQDSVISIRSDFPDAEEQKLSDDKLKALRESSNENINDYWNSLEIKAEEGGGLLAGSGNSNTTTKDEYLDPSVYTSIEIERIRLGLESRESIDAKHRQREERKQIKKRNAETRKRYEQEHSDSAYFARMDKAYDIVRNYSETPAETQVAVEEIPIEEPRRINIESRSLESVSLSDNSVICSLNSSSTSSRNISGSLSPAKATFLKSENLINGQRVTMRLMEDLVLSDGTMIPANTHIKGICHVSSRLNIKVNTINYGGKIYYVNLDIYDNDGTEGIYCPVIAQSQGKRAGKNLATSALSGIASTAASLFTRSPTVGRVFSRGVNEISSSIDGKGNVTVKVLSGYEFYVFEEIDNDK